LNLIEQVKQFYLLTINLSTTSPEPKQKKKRSKRQTRIKKNIVIFDELGRKNILILIQEESAQEKGKNAFFLCRIED
jgi:hypothetical protein